MVDRQRFQEYVQEALAHLYDYSYLQTHPLAALLAEGPLFEARGRTLYRMLVAAIDQLKPPAAAPATSPAWRKYQALFRRYVEGISPEQIAEDLGVTPRQSRRDHHEAIEAIADILFAPHQTTNIKPLTSALGVSPHPSVTPVAVESGRRNSDDGSALETELLRLAADAPSGPSDLATVAQSAIAIVYRLVKGRNITFALAVPDDLPPVAIDRTILRQMLLGLLGYAVESLQAGNVSVEARHSVDGVVLEIGVADVRPGTTAVAQSDAPDHLAIVRRLLDLQGGQLVVETDRDGPRLALTLPSVHRPTLLVIDDNPDVALLFQRYLDGSHRVLQAHSASEALAIVREACPDVITLDVLMPSADGWEVLQQIRAEENGRDVPIVVCSVLREGSLALSLGATEYLPKPVTRENLRSALERCRAGERRRGRRGSLADSG